MKTRMVGTKHHAQVLRAIVALVAIDVMHVFGGENGSAVGSFSDKDVARHVSVFVGARVSRTTKIGAPVPDRHSTFPIVMFDASENASVRVAVTGAETPPARGFLLPRYRLTATATTLRRGTAVDDAMRPSVAPATLTLAVPNVPRGRFDLAPAVAPATPSDRTTSGNYIKNSESPETPPAIRVDGNLRSHAVDFITGNVVGPDPDDLEALATWERLHQPPFNAPRKP
jgi:hypothetical protein